MYLNKSNIQIPKMMSVSFDGGNRWKRNLCPWVLNPFCTFLLKHISVPSSISQRSGTRHIENSSNSFKTNCFYSKKHYKTILEKCQNVVVNVWSSLHRRVGCVSRSPVGELTSSRVASVPTVTGTTYGIFFKNLYKLFHLSTSSSCTQLSHDAPPAPISQMVQLVPSASQSVRWDCCRGSEGDEGGLGAGQRPSSSSSSAG